MTFLESAAWQGISGLLAIAAIIVSVIVYRLQSPKKAFGYRVVSDSPLLRQPTILAGKLQIICAGKPVDALRFIVLKFSNPGRAAIQKSEFDGPITIALSEPSEVILASTSDLDPLDLPVQLSFKNDSITVEPMLLNGGDTFSVHCVLSNPNAKLTVSARIAGVKRLSTLQLDDDGNIQTATLLLFERLRIAVVAAALVASISATPYNSVRIGVENIVLALSTLIQK